MLIAWALGMSGVLLSAALVANESSREHLLDQIDRADIACDANVRTWKTPAALRENQLLLRERAIAAIGGLPAVKCPLNARTTRTVRRGGYRVEMVLFESFPGVHVTANLYLPDDAHFAAPYPALLLACGHAQNGKGAPAYQRGAVLASQAGFACLVFDPFDQGERFQGVAAERGCSADHDHISSIQTLLGGTFLRYLIWDSMRALDYLAARPEVDAERMGMWGNSGGGQATEWTAALDRRIKAAVVSGAITTQRLLNRENATPVTGWTEFSVDNQFACGLSHAALLLMAAPSPVLVESCLEDNMFPIRGARETVETVRGVLAACGMPRRAALLEVAGPHKWCESARQAGVDWFRRALCENRADEPFDVSRYAAFDIGFDPTQHDMGLTGGAEFVTEHGNVLDLPGERTVYDVMRGEKSEWGAGVGASEVARVSGIRMAFAEGFARKEVSRHVTNGVTVIRETFTDPDGFAVPALTCIPENAQGAPLLLLESGSWLVARDSCPVPNLQAGNQESSTLSPRTSNFKLQTSNLKPSIDSRILCKPDVFATGAVGAGRRDVPELARQLGRNVPAIQAEEILAIARDLRTRFGSAPEIAAHGSLCVAAAHVRKLRPDLVAGLRLCEPPPSWADAVSRGLEYDRYASIPGALRVYDWSVLVGNCEEL